MKTAYPFVLQFSGYPLPPAAPPEGEMSIGPINGNQVSLHPVVATNTINALEMQDNWDVSWFANYE